MAFQSRKSLLFSFIIILLCLTSSTFPKRTRSHLPSPIETPPVLAETQSTEAQTIEPEKKADSDSFMKAVGTMMLAQIKDVSFYAAIIIGFIYHQTFSTLAYFFSCVFCTLLGLAFVTNVLSWISSVVTGIVAAVFYAIFSLLTIYLLYSEKDPEIMADSVPGATKKNLKEAESQTTVEKRSGTEPTKGKEEVVVVVKKGENVKEITIEKKEEEETHLEHGDGDEETGLISGKSQKEVKEKSGFKKFMDDYANINFFRTQNKRFVYCVIMLLVSELSDFILIGIIDLRSDNSSTRVLVTSVVSYAIMSLIVFLVVLGIKYFMVRKFKFNVDSMKFTKYTGCLLLIGLGVVPPIIQATS